jgi:tRNA(fMet)-specific endonuclease VapC
MPYLLDTNICIYIIKKKPQSVLDKFNSIEPGEVAVSMITVSELYYGARKSSNPEKNLLALNKFLLPFNIFDFDLAAANRYSIIRTELESKGTPIGPLDTLIAAHAISLDYTLVTNNEREFNRVSGLQVENWV